MNLPQALLARYPAGMRPLTPPEPLGNAGGRSGTSLWRWTSGQGPMVARAWPVDGPSPSRLETLHAWLKQAGPLGFVPIPLASLDGRTFHREGGRFWEISPWMPGLSVKLEPPRQVVRQAFAGLARFHQCLLRFAIRRGPSPGLLARLGELEHWLRNGFNDLDGAISRSPDDEARKLSMRWLHQARRLAPGEWSRLRHHAAEEVPLQPCLRDARPDHFLFEGERLTGLVDFGAMDVETIAADLARLIGEWFPGDAGSRAEALDAYSQIRTLEAAELSHIEVFERSTALLLGGHWACWHFLERRKFEDPSAVLAGLRKGVDHIARLATMKGEHYGNQLMLRHGSVFRSS